MGKNAASDVITTAVFTLAWPDLFEQNENGKFAIQMIFDENKKGVDLKPLRAIIETVKKEVFGARMPSSAKVPEKDGHGVYEDGKARFDAGETESQYWTAYENTTIFRASSTRQPEVRDYATGQLITSADEIYAGCLCRATVHAYAYNEPTYKGVMLTLHGIEKLRDGVRIGGSGAKKVDVAKQFEAAGAPDLSEFDDPSFDPDSF